MPDVAEIASRTWGECVADVAELIAKATGTYHPTLRPSCPTWAYDAARAVVGYYDGLAVRAYLENSREQ